MTDSAYYVYLLHSQLQRFTKSDRGASKITDFARGAEISDQPERIECITRGRNKRGLSQAFCEKIVDIIIVSSCRIHAQVFNDPIA